MSADKDIDVSALRWSKAGFDRWEATDHNGQSWGLWKWRRQTDKDARYKTTGWYLHRLPNGFEFEPGVWCGRRVDDAKDVAAVLVAGWSWGGRSGDGERLMTRGEDSRLLSELISEVGDPR
jgi:hypothetical protein